MPYQEMKDTLFGRVLASDQNQALFHLHLAGQTTPQAEDQVAALSEIIDPSSGRSYGLLLVDTDARIAIWPDQRRTWTLATTPDPAQAIQDLRGCWQDPDYEPETCEECGEPLPEDEQEQQVCEDCETLLDEGLNDGLAARSTTDWDYGRE